MRSLVIHLGLPKTATSSLQTHYFPQLPGYLGKIDPGAKYRSSLFHDLLKRYDARSPVDEKRNFEIGGRPVWIPAMQEWVKEIEASDENILFCSSELLSKWDSPTESFSPWPVLDTTERLPRRGAHPVVGLLRQLRELLPQNIELKTILTLRNQGDWLFSLAAQMGVIDTGFVEQLIRNNDAFLDYYAITRDLECLRGPENHLTLLFENGLKHNAQEILQFSGYSQTIFESLGHDPSRVNVKNSEAGWSVLPPTPKQRFDQTLQRFRERSSLLDSHLGSNDALRRVLRPLLGFEARQRALGWIPAPGKPAYISLTHERRTAIQSHCETTNARLGAHLDIDLKALGY